MAVTTWDEFKNQTNVRVRLIAVVTGMLSVAPYTLRAFILSTVAGEIEGLPGIPINGRLATVPNLTYMSNEIGGTPALPEWSDMVCYREDGVDISFDQAGITFQDFDETWIVTHQPVVIFFGGGDLPFSEYKAIFTGTCDGIEPTDQTIIFQVSGNENRAWRRTMATNEITLANWPDAGNNAGKTIPVCIGPCWGVEPICVKLTLPQPQYIFHDIAAGPYYGIAVYVNGVPLSGGLWTDVGDGTVSFNQMPTGTVTLFVLGLYAYSYWATKITNLLTTFADVPAGNIDAAAVAQANLDLPYSVNFLVTKETPVMEVIASLSEGFPAWYKFNRAGIFRMSEITDPALKVADYVINNTTSVESPVAFNNNSFSRKFKGEVVYRANMEYYPNYKRIDAGNLSSTLTATQRIEFSTKWRKTKYELASVLTKFVYATAKNLKCRTSFELSAYALAEKFVNLFGVRRWVTTIDVPAINLEYDIGQIVEVTFETKLFDGTPWFRHGYEKKKMMILGMRENYNDYTVELKLWG